MQVLERASYNSHQAKHHTCASADQDHRTGQGTPAAEQRGTPRGVGDRLSLPGVGGGLCRAASQHAAPRALHAPGKCHHLQVSKQDPWEEFEVLTGIGMLACKAVIILP